ncbi:MAG: VWA domain-containing protein, partial [Lachnospiraceae bacterium]|nr:VWA domain-containing protein [Lachnospiraceae bacterium]
MKKKTIAALLIGAVVTTSMTGCGAMSSAACTAKTEAASSYVEAEYPAEASDEEVVYNGAYVPGYDDSAACESYESTACAPEAACTADEADFYGGGSTYIEAECGTALDMNAKTLCPDLRSPEPERRISGEKYNSVKENAFTEVSSSPLSTFGADVDTASYSNLRRMINDGFRLDDIPAGSIRTEELVNYFNYKYRSPRGNDAFAVNASIIDCPWNRETKLVNLGIKAKDSNDIEDTPSNIVFLIDVSGSMNSYDKLPLLKMGFEMLVDDLDEDDRVSIVTYASSSDIVISGVPGSEHTKLKKAINSLEAGGSTNGGDGIRSAYKLAGKYFIKGGNNRVIMATDGDLNVGITSEDELEELISDKKEDGVFLSVLGFGTGNYNETTLETLADKGNGNYSYIDCLSEAKKVLIDEFGSTLFTVAKDVKFQTEFNPRYVSEYRLVGYENRQMAAKDFNDDSKDGGEVGSGHAITVMYEIKLNDEDADRNETSELRYQDTSLSDEGRKSDEWMTVSVRYKEPDEDVSKLIYFPVSAKCYTKAPDCDT